MHHKITLCALASFFIQMLVLAGEESSEYVLPYPQTESYKVLQAYNGPWGHEKHAEFAYDFQMPMGSAVHAARSGYRHPE